MKTKQLFRQIFITMHYSFKDFEFDSESLVLRQNGQSLTIRHNEAKVLALLLGQANKVFSKEEILSLVWRDKVVSEQAVFQNISHLRNLFGNDAIKTFPKRGYQWQLNVEVVSSQEKSSEQASSAHSATISSDTLPTIQPKTLPLPVSNKVSAKSQNYLPYAAVASLIFIVFITFNFFNETPTANKALLKKLTYIPISHVKNDEKITLADNEHFDFTTLDDITTDEFHNNLELIYPKLAQSHPLILTAQIRRHNQHSYIDFLLKGPSGDWQGQLSAASADEVIEKLQKHLQQKVIYDLLNTAQSSELKQANLSIAHQKSPEDLIILGALIKVFVMMNESEKAMIMADKLEKVAEVQGDWQQLGNALLFQSEILTGKELYELSAHKLSKAINYFEQINDLKRQADAWFAQSWLDHQEKNYSGVKESLLNSARLSFEAKDIPRELDALTYLSILAYKHQQNDDKYLYLQQAENKMKSYQLPIYHFAKVPFHYAFFAKTTADKEPHWKQVLEYTKLTPDHWVAQSSRKELMLHFIDQGRLPEAEALINNISTDNAQNSYLYALLAQAKQDKEQFNHHAQQTFEQARLAGETRLSLDVALLLCSESSAQVNYDFYSQYINDNADNNWRRNNKEKLLAVNL